MFILYQLSEQHKNSRCLKTLSALIHRDIFSFHRCTQSNTHSFNVHDTCYNVYILFVFLHKSPGVRTQHSKSSDFTRSFSFAHPKNGSAVFAFVCKYIFIIILVRVTLGNVLHAKISTYRGKTLFFLRNIIIDLVLLAIQEC
jgi:hypothetical protein